MKLELPLSRAIIVIKLLFVRKLPHNCSSESTTYLVSVRNHEPAWFQINRKREDYMFLLVNK